MGDIGHESVGLERQLEIGGIVWTANAAGYGVGDVPTGTRVYFRSEHKTRVAAAGWDASMFRWVSNAELVQLFGTSAPLELPPGVDVDAIVHGAIHPGVFVPAGGASWTARLVDGVAVGAVGPNETLPPPGQPGVCFFTSDARQFRFLPMPRDQHPQRIEDVPSVQLGEWFEQAEPVDRC